MRARYIATGSILLSILVSGALFLSSCRSKTPDYMWQLHYPTEKKLNDIVALDDEHVWAVGDRGTILFFDGNVWIEQDSGTDSNLYEISAGSPDLVWIAGRIYRSDIPESILLTLDGGKWNPISEVKADQISILDEQHAWLTFAGSVKRFWDGCNFIDQDYGIYPYCDLLAIDSTHVWACGKGGPEFFDGGEWHAPLTDRIRDITPKDKIVEGGYPITSITALDVNHIWGVGLEGNIYFFDGSEWFYQDSGVDKNLIDVKAVDLKHVWAVGKEGTVLFFDGNRWSTLRNLSQYSFTYITASDNNHVWAIGNGGIYLGTPVEK